MADLIDRAESDMSQMINRVGSQAVSRGGQAAVKLSINVARSVTNAPYAAAAAVWGAARQAVHEATDTGKVTLKAFSNLADGRREVITLDDQAVSRELEKELKRHGVTWAMETHRDGSTTFHVQGADVQLVQHALGVAAERVDERLVRRGDVRQEPTPDVQATEAVPTHGTDELREDAPEQSVVDDDLHRSEEGTARPVEDPDRAAPAVVEQDGSVTGRGGHSDQREPAATRAEQAPQVSARDQTRRRNADRIDKKVTEKKAEMSADKARTKKRAPRRDAASEPRPSRRG